MKITLHIFNLLNCTMQTKNFSAAPPSYRCVFIVIEKKKTGEGTIIAFSNRTVVLEWLKQQPGHLYLEKAGSLATPLTSYMKLARALSTEMTVHVSIVQTDINKRNERYEIIKAPLLQRL